MGDDLMPQLRTALHEPHLFIGLDWNLFGGQALVRISKPGKTERSKLIPLLPVIVADEDQKHSDILRMIADVLEQEGR